MSFDFWNLHVYNCFSLDWLNSSIHLFMSKLLLMPLKSSKDLRNCYFCNIRLTSFSWLLTLATSCLIYYNSSKILSSIQSSLTNKALIIKHFFAFCRTISQKCNDHCRPGWIVQLTHNSLSWHTLQLAAEFFNDFYKIDDRGLLLLWIAVLWD